MFLKTPEPYHFNPQYLLKLEKIFNAKYLGYWAIKDKKDQWSEIPVDVFYQPNPDKSKGHSEYFGIFVEGNQFFLCNAKSAFDGPILGVLSDDGEVLVSRFRHDYVSKEMIFTDGGRDYFRHSKSKVIEIKVNNGEYELNLLNN